MHYIEISKNGSWRVRERVIGSPAMDEKKTAENIKEKCKICLEVAFFRI